MSSKNFKCIIDFIKNVFNNLDYTPLHAPVFRGKEREYVNDAINSTYVSSVGAYVDRFEKELANFTGSKFAIAMVNGTNALHISLLVCGVKEDDEVISQSLTFIATANAISYIKAHPVFVDVDKDTLGMSPSSLENFLENNAAIKADGYTYNKNTGRKISACVPMHTFGFPNRIDEIEKICKDWNIELVEDAAESIGSYYKNIHTGNFGKVGVFSFNGNKTITCGGGGAVITNDETIAKKIKHLTTQAKVPHRWDFVHDSIGYNYRMPNLNAALACAQLEMLPEFLLSKRELAIRYQVFFSLTPFTCLKEIDNAKANYWLNVILVSDLKERDEFLEFSNSNNVMTRPAWELMHKLKMFENCEHNDMKNSEWLSERIINIPSSVR